MSQFDLTVFLKKSQRISTMEKFKKKEGKRFPEHALMFLSSEEINCRFRGRLDEIKQEHDFIPDEVYISSESDGRITSVDMGATLLGLEVIFRTWIDVRQLSKPPKFIEGKWVSGFSFEREVAQEYNRCALHFEGVYRQLKSTRKARDLPSMERERAVRFIDEARNRSLDTLSMYRQTCATNAAKKQLRAELQSLNLLEARLKMLDPRRIRP